MPDPTQSERLLAQNRLGPEPIIKSSKNGHICDAELHFAFWQQFGRVSVVA
jgi:hypothetical protein